ncbi:MAG: N-acetyltransferase [Sulfitobacter sp.]
MSALHNAAFIVDRGWSSQEFGDLLDSPHVQSFTYPHGFALTRTIAQESELLTLAVDPAHQRQGIAKALLMQWLSAISQMADTAFLEVAADNHAARALYAQVGFEQIAQRRAYYLRKAAPAVDALILRRDLTLGQTPDSTPILPEIG